MFILNKNFKNFTRTQSVIVWLVVIVVALITATTLYTPVSVKADHNANHSAQQCREAGGTWDDNRCNNESGGVLVNQQTKCRSTGGQWIVQSEVVGGRAIDASYCRCPSGRNLINGSCVSATSPVPDQTSDPQFAPTDCNDSDLNADNCGIVRYIVIVTNFLAALVGVVVVGSIIAGGIQYSMAGSDPQKISAAKDRIRNSIIALLFFIFTYSLLNWLVPGGVL